MNSLIILILSLALSCASSSELRVSCCYAIFLFSNTIRLLTHTIHHRYILHQESRNLRALSCTYVCPIFAVPKPNLECFNTFDDCNCIDGFFKGDNVCIPGQAPPTKRPTRAPIKVLTTSVPIIQPPILKPTKAPTKKPTKAPTLKPAKAPTKKPTKAPTLKPTKAPSQKPTMALTLKPTKAPTKKPTKAPTLKPTKAPIKQPVTNCNYICPLNSYTKKSNRCPKGFGDCKCNYGYDDSRGKDGCERHACSFICPLNSYSKKSNRCPKDFGDCKCNDGYDDLKRKDECIRRTENDEDDDEDEDDRKKM